MMRSEKDRERADKAETDLASLSELSQQMRASNQSLMAQLSKKKKDDSRSTNVAGRGGGRGRVGKAKKAFAQKQDTEKKRKSSLANGVEGLVRANRQKKALERRALQATRDTATNPERTRMNGKDVITTSNPI